MPATSKKQQKFMGLVRALQKGKVSPSKVSKKVKDVAKDMKPKDVKKYASTKHKGLPNKVKSEAKKMSDTDMYNYLMYMRKYKPDIWRDLQGNKKVKKIMKKFESINEKACWSGYKQIGMKKKNGKKVPNCVPESYDIWNDRYWGSQYNTQNQIDAWGVRDYIQLNNLNFYDWEPEPFDFMYFDINNDGDKIMKLYDIVKEQIDMSGSDVYFEGGSKERDNYGKDGHK